MPGSFARDVPYDPALYFLGEEIAVTVRAWASGYDLFHPPEVLAWHYFGRDGQPKHWDDQPFSWQPRDQVRMSRIQRLLTGQLAGRFGCGTIRTIADYEAYSGISIRHRSIQEFTRLGGEPPNPVDYRLLIAQSNDVNW